jgi:DNA-binding PadR family transcriptional regulator
LGWLLEGQLGAFSMFEQLPSRKELVVLRLLRDSPSGMYGLELVKASKGDLGQTTVYVTLARMEEKGLIKSSTPKKADHPGLPRARYKLDAVGERALRAADLAQSVMQGAMPRGG